MSIFSSLVLLLPLPLLLLTSFITPSSSASDTVFIYDHCSQAKFMQGSAYESGVKSVLTSIVNAAMFSSYNSLTVLATSSSSSSQDIPIYGLFQCRGDLAPAGCFHCVAQAVSQLGTICPDFTGGYLLLDGCFVRYDDSQFLGGEDNTFIVRKCGPPDGFNSNVLTQRDAVLAYLETSDGGYKMFRMTRFGNLQGMAQCMGDLNASECQDCLSNAIGRLRVECGFAQWGQIYLAKCYVHFSFSEGGRHSAGGNGKHKNNKKDELLKALEMIGKLMAVVIVLVTFISSLKKLKRWLRKASRMGGGSIGGQSGNTGAQSSVGKQSENTGAPSSVIRQSENKEAPSSVRRPSENSEAPSSVRRPSENSEAPSSVSRPSENSEEPSC